MNCCDQSFYPVDVKLASHPTVLGTPGRARKTGELTNRSIYGLQSNRFRIGIRESFHRPTIEATRDPGMLQRSVERAATRKRHEGGHEEEPERTSPVRHHSASQSHFAPARIS